MDTTRIGWGIITWFLGIIVPTMHHVLLHWPIAWERTGNVITRSQHVFRSLPWVDWVYLIAMAVVGFHLIVTGAKGRHAER